MRSLVHGRSHGLELLEVSIQEGERVRRWYIVSGCGDRSMRENEGWMVTKVWTELEVDKWLGLTMSCTALNIHM